MSTAENNTVRRTLGCSANPKLNSELKSEGRGSAAERFEREALPSNICPAPTCDVEFTLRRGLPAVWLRLWRYTLLATSSVTAQGDSDGGEMRPLSSRSCSHLYLWRWFGRALASASGSCLVEEGAGATRTGYD